MFKPTSKNWYLIFYKIDPYAKVPFSSISGWGAILYLKHNKKKKIKTIKTIGFRYELDLAVYVYNTYGFRDLIDKIDSTLLSPSA